MLGLYINVFLTSLCENPKKKSHNSCVANRPTQVDLVPAIYSLVNFSANLSENLDNLCLWEKIFQLPCSVLQAYFGA